ncbi:MAG: tetratricopeptide repeat protein, partial [Gimesia sp.]
LAGYLQAYNDSPKKQRYVDNQHMESVCNLITAKWPESDRANDARIQLGNIYSQTERPAEAAKWYSQVPKTAPQYVDAQIRAGQSYWNSYLTTMARRSETKPANVNEWATLAEKHLRIGIAATLKSLPPTAATPENVTAAKTSLAQIVLNNGKYQEAIDILSKAPHSVLKAIHLAKGKKRPAKGVQSSQFANLVYQLQLRAYIGLQQIDLARKAMKQLEESASGTGGESITEMYRQLGEKITEEIERLKAAGDKKRINDVRKSLETFLTDIFKRKDQTYGSLVWIGETYFGMGQGASENPAIARKYYDKAAAAFEEIQKRQNATGDFIPGNFQVGITLRLVNCKREQGEFEAALKLITPVLKEKDKSPEVQFEAASILQDWAASGQPDSDKKYLEAINGMTLPNGALLRGWNYLARLLQGSIATTGREDLKKMYYKAQYNTIDCRYKYGVAQNDAKELERAKFETNVFGQISVDLPDDVWDRFNQLYRNIQTDLGEDPQDLEKRVAASAKVAANENQQLDSATPTDTQQKVAQQSASDAEAEGGSNTLIILAVILLGVGGAVAFYFFGMKPGKKSPSSYQLAADMGAPPLISAPPEFSVPKPATKSSQSKPTKNALPNITVDKPVTIDKPKQKSAPEKEKTKQKSERGEPGKEKRKLTPEQIAARKAKLAQMSPEELAARKAAVAKKKAAQAKQKKQSRPRPEGESKDV